MTGIFRSQIPLLENRWLQAALFALLFITSFSLSGTLLPNSTNLDASWQASIEYAAAHNWLFGSDILFTYGPLGYLTSRFGQGFLQLPRILSALAMSGVTAWLVLHTAKSLQGISAVMLLGWLALFATTADAEQNIFFIIAGCSLALMAEKRPLWALLLLPPFLALLSLIKFTFFIAAAAAMLFCAARLLSPGDRRRALLPPALFSASFCLLWLLTGQRFSTLLPWLKGSREIASGYSEAMAITPAPLVLACAAASLVIFLALLACQFSQPDRRLPELAPLLILLAAFFLSWKQGVVRADELHFARFAFSMPLFLALALSRVPKNSALSRNPRYPALLLGLTMLLCLLTVQLSFPANLSWQSLGRDFLTKTPARITQLIKIATGRTADCFPDSSTKGAQEYLPPIAPLVGNDTVDVMGSAAWFAMGNRLNYRPRPIVQSYSAYTPYLQQLNLAYLQSAKRPDWMMVLMDTLDDRLPVMEDALLFPWLLRNYELAWHDDIILLFRAKPTAVIPQSKPVTAKTIRLGEKLDFTAIRQDKPLFLQVDIKASLLGKAAGLIYQRPPLQMTLEFDADRLTRRFVPSMAREGFLVNPLLLNIDDVTAYLKGHKRLLKSITITAPPGTEALYRDEIRIKLLQIDL